MINKKGPLRRKTVSQAWKCVHTTAKHTSITVLEVGEEADNVWVAQPGVDLDFTAKLVDDPCLLRQQPFAQAKQYKVVLTNKKTWCNKLTVVWVMEHANSRQKRNRGFLCPVYLDLLLQHDLHC